MAESWATTTFHCRRIAGLLQAEELTLLESALPAAETTLQDLAEAGYVDAEFPRGAEPLPLVAVRSRRGVCEWRSVQVPQVEGGDKKLSL